jgi:hypothetical protein
VRCEVTARASASDTWNLVGVEENRIDSIKMPQNYYSVNKIIEHVMNLKYLGAEMTSEVNIKKKYVSIRIR